MPGRAYAVGKRRRAGQPAIVGRPRGRGEILLAVRLRKRLQRPLTRGQGEVDQRGAGGRRAHDNALAVRRPERKVERAVGGKGLLPRVAAVGPYRPGFVRAAAIRIEKNPPAVRRPARDAILERVVGELDGVVAVHRRHEQVLLRRRQVEHDPLAVGRDVRRAHGPPSLGHLTAACRPPSPPPRRKPFRKRLAWFWLSSVAKARRRPSREMLMKPAHGTGTGTCSGAPRGAARSLVDRHPPDAHAAVAVAGEIDVPPVGRPHRIPVEVRVVDDRPRRAARGGHRPQHPAAPSPAAGPRRRCAGRSATSSAARRPPLPATVCRPVARSIRSSWLSDTRTVGSVTASVAQTIDRPSGDQAGLLPMSEILVSPPPSAFIRKMPPPACSERNAIRLPSGENAGSLQLSAMPAVRFFCRPVGTSSGDRCRSCRRPPP